MRDDEASPDHARFADEIHALTEQLGKLREALTALKIAIDHQDEADAFVRKIREDLNAGEIPPSGENQQPSP